MWPTGLAQTPCLRGSASAAPCPGGKQPPAAWASNSKNGVWPTKVDPLARAIPPPNKPPKEMPKEQNNGAARHSRRALPSPPALVAPSGPTDPAPPWALRPDGPDGWLGGRALRRNRAAGPRSAKPRRTAASICWRAALRSCRHAKLLSSKASQAKALNTMHVWHESTFCSDNHPRHS